MRTTWLLCTVTFKIYDFNLLICIDPKYMEVG